MSSVLELEGAADSRPLEYGTEFVAVDFLENEGDADDEVGFHFGKGLEQQFGGRELAEDGDVSSVASGVSMSKAQP